MRDLDGRYSFFLEELLLTSENLLEEVLVDMGLWRHEILKVLIEVDVEVGLGLQLPGQLVGQDAI